MKINENISLFKTNTETKSVNRLKLSSLVWNPNALRYKTRTKVKEIRRESRVLRKGRFIRSFGICHHFAALLA